MKKTNSFKSLGGLIYSTNPEAMSQENEEINDSIPKDQQVLKVVLDKKKRAGKIVTLITGFEGNDEDFKDLAKQLKTKCGVGGSAKDGEIIIQGDFKSTIINHLKSLGFGKVVG